MLRGFRAELPAVRLSKYFDLSGLNILGWTQDLHLSRIGRRTGEKAQQLGEFGVVGRGRDRIRIRVD